MYDFVPRREVLKVLNIHAQTLYKMALNGEIETIKIGDTQHYNLKKFLFKNGVNINKNRRKICYCRVSSRKQKGDLERQINYMRQQFPNYEIIKDIGSGLNMNRKGLQEIINEGILGNIEEIVITYKDRLMRFGFEIVENIINKYSNGKITILNATEEKTPHEEVTEDIIQIMNVYVAKINGLRKYKQKIKKTLLKDNKKHKK